MNDIANYLVSHYKGVYRLRTPIDENTKMFPREYNGQFAENDVYIDCQKGVKLFHYGNRTLEAYIPSLGRGRNILKAIEETFHEEIIFDIEETDKEVLFKFNAKYTEQLEPYLKPRTSGANISPFSSKNLPKNKTYKIPNEDLVAYKNLIANLPQNQLILVGKYTTSFLQSLTTKKNTWDMIKADMALKGLKGKEYIHSIGQWDKYIKYLERNLNELYKSNL